MKRKTVQEYLDECKSEYLKKVAVKKDVIFQLQEAGFPLDMELDEKTLGHVTEENSFLEVLNRALLSWS